MNGSRYEVATRTYDNTAKTITNVSNKQACESSFCKEDFFFFRFFKRANSGSGDNLDLVV